MHRLLAAAVLSIAISPAWAGKRITMEVTDPASKQSSTREILLDADRLRFNEGTTSVMFLTRGGSRIVMLDKTRNEYRELDQATIQQLSGALAGAMAQMQAQMKNMSPEQRAVMEQVMGRGASAAAQITYTAKGASSVNGFRCTNYDGMRAGQKVSELCAAQPAELKLTPADTQVLQKLRDFASGLINSLQNSPISSLATVNELLPEGVNGFPVQSITYVAGKPADRTAIKSIVEASLTDADFATGTAKKVELQLPGGRGPGKAK